MVAVLSNAGDQVPVIPFCEMVGNGIAGAPIHIAPIGAKVGAVLLTTLTVTVIVVLVEHCPVSGVKV